MEFNLVSALVLRKASIFLHTYIGLQAKSEIKVFEKYSLKFYEHRLLPICSTI